MSILNAISIAIQGIPLEIREERSKYNKSKTYFQKMSSQSGLFIFSHNFQ